MAGLLPSTPDTSAVDESAPKVIGMDSDGADELIGALSSQTARRILSCLHDEPAPPSTLATRAGTSLQNAQYHLQKLERAGLIEEIDTCYSEKGREMSVFAPTDRPLVVVAGTEKDTLDLKSAVSRILGAIGLLGVVSIIVEEIFGSGVIQLLPWFPTGQGTDDTPESFATEAEPGVGPETLEPVETAVGLPPGALFFAGGLFIIVVVILTWLIRSHVWHARIGN